VLAIITAVSTHALDPYKPLRSEKEPVKVQVVALEWKWLFIYPDQGIATVNYLNIPEDTPVELTITADAPMNSFWVPALAGQVYAMTGMSTKLHFMADSTATHNGSSANLSGDGFADMRFKVNAMTQDDFNAWIQQSMASSDWLTPASYEELEKPSKAVPEKTYGLVQGNIYDDVIMKYMGETNSQNQTEIEGAK
jgi:cytochrome o ubiquinol oxidase subunit II